MIVETHHVVRERTFRPCNHALKEVLDTLHLEHATGKLVVNLSQGTIGSIQFEEKAKISSSSDHVQISLDTKESSMSRMPVHRESLKV